MPVRKKFLAKNFKRLTVNLVVLAEHWRSHLLRGIAAGNLLRHNHLPCCGADSRQLGPENGSSHNRYNTAKSHGHWCA